MSAFVRDFLIMAKPNGAICNLDCRYCYYLEKNQLYPESSSFRMPPYVLEDYIAQCIKATPGPSVKFSWHGGEPTLLGLDYYREIVALQRKHLPPGKRVANSLQTNGTTLDAQWCYFLAKEGFFVGLSLDGPQEQHDRYRVNKGQQPTHADVMRGLRLLQRHGVHLDILCVVHDQNVEQPLEVYRFLKENGARSITFLHLVERVKGAPGEVGPHSVPPEGYGKFLCAIFDEWVRQDVGQIAVQIFDEGLRVALGKEQGLCIFRKTCGNVLALEHNGDLFSCDHFVDHEHRLGNVMETPLVELLTHPKQTEFGQAKQRSLPRQCRACEVLPLCNGGCPKDRLSRTLEGEDGLNYLCGAYKRFFSHTRPHIQRMAALMRANHPRERLQDLMWPKEARSIAAVERNEPCPCGSGRKFKRCCLRG